VVVFREAEAIVRLNSPAAIRMPGIYAGRSYWPLLGDMAWRPGTEDRARNTYENAVLSKQLASPAPGELAVGFRPPHAGLVTCSARLGR
jgi:hypothetical protein